MAYPTFYPFKVRHYQASSTTSNTVVSAPVVARAKLIGAALVTSTLASQTAAGVVDITVNGSTASGYGGLSITTSTGNSATVFPAPTANVFLAPGDVLATVASSVVGFNCTYIVREF